MLKSGEGAEAQMDVWFGIIRAPEEEFGSQEEIRKLPLSTPLQSKSAEAFAKLKKLISMGQKPVFL